MIVFQDFALNFRSAFDSKPCHSNAWFPSGPPSTLTLCFIKGFPPMRHHSRRPFIASLITSLTTSLFLTALLVGTSTQQAHADTTPQKKSSQKQAKTTKRSPRPKNPAMTPVEDIKGLPRVLLVGDSISIGYTVPAREALRSKANVHRPLTSGEIRPLSPPAQRAEWKGMLPPTTTSPSMSWQNTELKYTTCMVQ